MNKNCIYVVSGYMRTGTSMMMRCLEAGGLSAKYDRLKAINPEINQYGCYEVRAGEQNVKNFPALDEYRGHLVKAMYDKIPNIAKAHKENFRIVFMMRDPDEILSSLKAQRKNIHFTHNQILKNLQTYTLEMGAYLKLLEDKPNIILERFWYRDLLENPQGHFKRLRENGWPIDPTACAQKVEVELYRHRNI